MDRKISLGSKVIDDLIYWQKVDKKITKRIHRIFKEVIRSPFEGIGKPEPLKGMGTNTWSRRLDQEHRIIYVVNDDSIEILSCKGHYE